MTLHLPCVSGLLVIACSAHHDCDAGPSEAFYVGPLVTSTPTRLPTRLMLPDSVLVNRSPSQLSPLGKKPPLCGPIDLQASTGDAAAGPVSNAGKADGGQVLCPELTCTPNLSALSS